MTKAYKVSELKEFTKLISDDAVWQICVLRKDRALEYPCIPCVLADAFGEPYVAIQYAKKLNKRDPENYYWVIERKLSDAKFAYDGIKMPKDIEDEW